MSHAHISLRLARISEAATIAAMSRNLIEYGLHWRWTPERIRASIRVANTNVLVARIDEHIVGFAVMRYADDTAHLDLLAVAPAYRRMGIGQQLLRWLEKCALVAGIATINLEVRDRNHGAQRFYERMDYRPVTRVLGYYQGVETALRMSRELLMTVNPAHGR